MTFEEKRLYHQVYPIKLATDISASIITLYLFWYHYFILGFFLHFALPLAGSLIVIRYAKLDSIKASPLGNYLHRYMTPFYETVRLAGDIITVIGAWYHLPWLIAAGLLVVLVAWMNGKVSFLH